MWSFESFNILCLLSYIAATIFFPVAMVLGAKILGPSNPNRVKNSTFECGQIPTGEARVQFTGQYFLYAIIYAMFAPLAIFLLLIAPHVISFDAQMLTLAVTIIIITSMTCLSAAISVQQMRR